MNKRRPNGDGTVRKRSDGRWEGRVIVGHKEDGSPIFEFVFAKSQKAMLQKIHQLMEEYKGIDLNCNSEMTLGAWLDRWIASYGKLNLRPSTVSGYKANIASIKRYLGGKQIRRVTTAEIQEMYNQLAQNGRQKPDKNGSTALAPSSVRHIHMMLHEALDAAVSEGMIAKNPTKGTVIPKNKRAEMRVLNEEQLDRFITMIEQEPLWYDFFYTEITTGLRRGEICGLRWEDLDEQNGTLHIRRSVAGHGSDKTEQGDTKTEAGRRIILLPNSTFELLKRRKKMKYSEWIFPEFLKPDLPISPDSAYRRLKELLKAGDLPDIRFHDLRHTFATHALKSGIDAKTLSGLLGHTNASFTLDTYTHITDDMKRNASNVVESFMTNIFGEDLIPWETAEKKEKEQ